jgi:hypothetical protein
MLKKLIILIVCAIVVLTLYRSGRLDFLRPKRITFDTIVSQFQKDGLLVTSRQAASFKPTGAVEGEEMIILGTRVGVFRFENSGRRDIEFENYKPGVGDAIAQSMGITTQLGVESRPVSGPETHPAKKGLFLLIAYSNDRGVTKQIIDSFSRL